MKKSIVWLASYPKSGNTWMRLFLSNYLMNAQTPLSINQVHRFGLGDAIPALYNRVAGKEIDTSNSHVTLSLRSKVMRAIVANNADVNFVKTHNTCNPAFGIELVEPQYTRSAIYIVRNPLDMVLSYARHFALTPERAVEAIARPDNANAPDERSVWQYLGNWSDHVKSWTEVKAFPVVALRYEDMLEKPEATFAKALKCVGVEPEIERLKRAIKFSSFKEVTRQEKESSFVERSPHSETFFNKGSSGYWRDELDSKLVEKIRKTHKKMMKKYGYYDV